MKKDYHSINNKDHIYSETSEFPLGGQTSKKITKSRFFLKVLFNLITVSATLLALITIANKYDFINTDSRQIPTSSHGSENTHSKGGLMLRELYVQELPNEDYLKEYFEKLDSKLKAQKAQAEKNGVKNFNEIINSSDEFSTKKFSKIKKWSSDNPKNAKSLEIAKQSGLFTTSNTDNPFLEYNIKVLKKGSQKSPYSTKNEPKFKKIKPVFPNSSQNSFAKNRGVHRLKPSRTGRELIKNHFEFLSSKNGYSRSFWSLDKQSDLYTKFHKTSFTDKLIELFSFSSQNHRNVPERFRSNKAEQIDNTKDDILIEEPFVISEKGPGWKYKIDDGLLIPNMKDKQTILSLAKMSSNAYKPADADDWEHLDKGWKNESGIGWDSDGLRGYVFASENDDTIVISFKGTSTSVFSVGGGPTSANDKLNDNRLFSCCCARVDYSWSTVCDCYLGSNKCNYTCLQNSLESDDLYFYVASKVIMDVSNRYPNAFIILTGHSLGGSIATLLGQTFGLPAVGFETPGDLLPARRLHSPMPPNMDFNSVPIWHVGHNTDPIFMGACTGASSSCYYAGYAMESKCHIGRTGVFDTMSHLNWRPDVRHHRIKDVIDYVLESWETDKVNASIPEFIYDADCEECGLWEFEEDSPE
ncbi:hypothetical protein BB559_006069 [Furculomyces boomerangus]|uniref:triacylglycerol lipase n=1 Tax=Furculomyces boomerangus TaxID=61424 RepID=A0A2T9Y4V9_9FUNG|nr:hypothetical protein BB559_006069 [Furculomyces boomerangus]